MATTERGTGHPDSGDAPGDEEIVAGGAPPSDGPDGEGEEGDEIVGAPRRRTVALVSALVLLVIVIAVGAVILGVTQTEYGQNKVRNWLVTRIGQSLKGRGSLYVGKISGGLVRGVVVDSIAIRDEEDSLFVSIGRLEVAYDPRDLWDRRILLRRLILDRVTVNLRRHADDVWNFRRIFPSGKSGTTALPSARKLGDFIVMDSVELRSVDVMLTQRWHPADSLRGAKRDSAVRYALNGWVCSPSFWKGDPHWTAQACGKEIRPTKEGLKRTYRWHVHDAVMPYARIADPDSVGRYFIASKLDVDEADPPFPVRNMRGTLKWLGDTVWFDLNHFDLPRSVGRATGNLQWGDSTVGGKLVARRPMRYRIRVQGDSVSLADINWVYPTLPKTGGGKMNLAIDNDPRNLDVLNYAITDMDVRSTRSHLTGDMTFGVGWPVLVVKDLDLRADPVDFKLLETINGKTFPVAWAGQLFGTVKGRGGPLDRFLVDDARITFRDANVPGAVARASGRGGLDILFPAYTKFRGFSVDVETFDLRTPQFLFPNFARLQGTVSGHAVLDSSWLDVRFRNADITHHDGDLPVSRFTGNGRVTNDPKTILFDLDVEAFPLSFTTMAHSYPLLPARGEYSGPMRLRGSLGDLTLAASLSGPAGQMALDGHFDFLAPLFAMRGNAQVHQLDVGTLLGDSTLPSTRLNATMSADIQGDSLANLVGALAVDVASGSRVDTVRFYPSMARFAFGDGRMRVDSLRVETTAARVEGAGAIGLMPGVVDSIRYRMYVDSLGGLRPFLTARDSRAAQRLAAADTAIHGRQRDSVVAAIGDSLAGFLRVDGVLAGRLDSLSTAGRVMAAELFLFGDAARQLDATYRFDGLPAAPRGRAELALDHPVVAGVRLSSAEAALDLVDQNHGHLTASVASETGPAFGAGLAFVRAGDTTRLRVDSLAARLGERRWSLAAPADVRIDSATIALDTLRLVDSVGGVLQLSALLPTDGPIALAFDAERLPLGDVGAVMQTRTKLGGRASLHLQAQGTRAAPIMQLRATTDSVVVGTIKVPNIVMGGSYASRRANVRLQFLRDTATVLSVIGELPVDLALVAVDDRLPDDSLRGRISAANVDLGLIEAMAPQEVQRVHGTMSTDIAIGGTLSQPQFAGQFRLANGDMTLPRIGIRPRRITADVRFTRDSVTITQLSATSGERNGTLNVSGAMSVHELRASSFRLDVRAHDFTALHTRRIADLDLSGGVSLVGTVDLTRDSASKRREFGGEGTLHGNLTIPRGVLYLRDAPQKQVLALDSTAFADLVADPTVSANDNILPKAPPKFVRNLTIEDFPIRLGDDVWLRSSAANIKLGGEIAVTKSEQQDSLALAGTLSANRGTYRLDLGLVQRTFNLTSGEIRFTGEPGFDPALAITAVYTVRQPEQQDIRIRATIGGTLSHMQLDLSSDQQYAISYTEILSYLVFGVPTFAIGQQGESALRPVAQALLPSLGGVLERVLGEQVGGIFDVLSIQSTGLGQERANEAGARDYLSGYRIGLGKQIGSRTFVTASSGLCQLGSKAGGGGSQTRFRESLGLLVEHRLGGGVSAQFGVEPATSALNCNRVNPLNITTPPQLGFDLFKEWRF